MSSAFLLDLGQCIGCQGCVVACNTGNELAEGTNYIRIDEQVRGTFPDLSGGFQNQRCYHCTDAACVEVCPTGALYREDDLTRVNADACSGCEYCVQACPFSIPQMAGGVATKCDGCRDVVRAGGTPWCVTTCPSDALRFDSREEIAAEAHRRAGILRGKYPNAQVYGESEAGGLGVLMVLPDDPQTLGLPVDPKIPVSAEAWQRGVKPLSLGSTALAVIGAGLAAVIARRNHMQELQDLESTEVGASTAADAGEETS